MRVDQAVPYQSHFSIREETLYAHLVPVLLPLAQIGLTGSVYLTLSISVERFITVKYPFFKVNIRNLS